MIISRSIPWKDIQEFKKNEFIKIESYLFLKKL